MNTLLFLFALLPLVVATPWYNDPINLVCFYPLIDGSFADASGRTTAVVTPSPPPPPVAVNAMGTVFNNPSTASIAVQWNGPFTFSVSMMFRFNAQPSSQYVLLGSSSTDSTQKFAITMWSSSMVITMGGGVATYPLTWSLGRWQHLTVSFGGSSVVLYIDGQPVSPSSMNGTFSTLTTNSAAILLSDPILSLASAPVSLFNFRQFVFAVSADQASDVYTGDLNQLCTPSASSIFPQCMQSFETPVVGDYEYLDSFGSWEFTDDWQATGTGGIATVGGTFNPANSAAPPDGVQYAFIQNVGTWVMASLVTPLTNLVTGATYHINLSYNLRQAGFVSQTSDIYLFCKGETIAVWSAFGVSGPPSDWISATSASFTASDETMTVQFYTTNDILYANNTFLIDAVVVVPE